MKIRIGLVFALAALSATTFTAQTKAASPNSAIVGVWRASDEGQPFLTLTVTDESGELTGAILFYLHRREPGQAHDVHTRQSSADLPSRLRRPNSYVSGQPPPRASTPHAFRSAGDLSLQTRRPQPNPVRQRKRRGPAHRADSQRSSSNAV